MKRLSSQLYVQVLIGIVLGALVGYFWPDIGSALQPLATAFIKLIKMLLAPIIFGTVVLGIAKMGNIHEVGRIGTVSLIYFELVSTLALVIGLIVVNLMQPGVGMNIDVGQVDTTAIAGYQQTAAEHGGIIDFFLDIIPATLVGAFASGAMLQVILVAVLFGVALVQVGDGGRPFVEVLDASMQALFRIVGMVMKFAPLGAGAGVAYTIGKHGIGTLWSLGYLMLAVYLTSFLFVVVILGAIARLSGFPLLHFLRYFKDEIFITLATCSTEAVMPRMMAKLERLGVAKPVVGLVLPTGYAFNADGTCIYLTMAAVFIAQATNTDLNLCGAARDPRHSPAYLQGIGGRGGSGLRDARGDTVHLRHGSGRRTCAPPRRRSLHERSPSRREPDRQRRRDHRGSEMGERPRHRGGWPRHHRAKRRGPASGHRAGLACPKLLIAPPINITSKHERKTLCVSSTSVK